MATELLSPIQPGTRHLFRLSRELMESQRSINYATGPHLPLHLSIRAKGQIVVLNTRTGRRWDQEVSIPRQKASGPLQIDLAFETASVSVCLDQQPPLLFTRGVDFGEAERIEYVSGAQFSATLPPPMSSDPYPHPHACGAIDRATSTLIRGWAFDPEHPDQNLLVDILLNGVKIGEVPANRERPDLSAADPRLARRGFLFRMPPDLVAAPGEQRITARVAGMQRGFSGSPWVIGRRLTHEDTAAFLEF